MTGSYQQGLNDELALLQRLAKHHQVQPSSRDENRLQDIDCWVDGFTFNDIADIIDQVKDKL